MDKSNWAAMVLFHCEKDAIDCVHFVCSSDADEPNAKIADDNKYRVVFYTDEAYRRALIFRISIYGFAM